MDSKYFRERLLQQSNPIKDHSRYRGVISGRIENGMFKRRLCKTGDTILFISEIKRRLHGSNLVQNTLKPIRCQNQAFKIPYSSKYGALAKIKSIQRKGLKLEQAENKLKASSI
jgi:hypothetical protein